MKIPVLGEVNSETGKITFYDKDYIEFEPKEAQKPLSVSHTQDFKPIHQPKVGVNNNQIKLFSKL